MLCFLIEIGDIMDITISQLFLSLLSGFGGALILHSLTVRESKKACRKAVLKEIEFGIYKAITIVSGFRRNSPHISFKGIELQIYPSATSKHPDLFREKQTLQLMFLYNSFKTFNENAKGAATNDNYNNLVNLLWEDIIKFFNIATDDIIPDSLRKYQNDIVNLRIADNPPQLPGLFEL
jgi:hypothetical protein